MSRKTRKLIWSAPLVTVLAVAGALAIFVMLVPDEAAADERAGHGPPAAVTGLDATTVADDPSTPDVDGQTMVMLSWYVPSAAATGAATSYRIDVSRDTRVWHALAASVSDTAADAECGSTAAANMRCYIDDMLMPNTTYYYRVFAENAQGISGVSVDPTYDYDTTEPVINPSKALSLTATTTLEEQINLDWDEPSTNGGADIVQYCIQVTRLGVDFTDLAATAQDPECRVAEVAAIPDAKKTLINELAADTGTTPQTIVVGADDTEYMHIDLDTPDVIVLRYRVYAVTKDADDFTRISLAASNTATGRTVKDRRTFDDPLAKPTAVQNLRAVAHMGTSNQPALHLFWNAPANREEDGYPENWTVRVHKFADTDDDKEYEWELVMGTEPANDAAGAPAQFVVDQTAAETLDDGNPRTERYRVRYIIDPDENVEDDEIIGAGTEVRVSLPLIDADDVENLLPLITKSTGNGPTPILVVGASGYEEELENSRNLRFRHNPRFPIMAIDLMWQRNANSHADEDENIPTGYVIDYSTDEGVTWLRLNNADMPSDLGSTTHYTHKNVKPGAQYTYRVFPWHKNTFGNPETIDASTQEADLPDPVDNLRVMADGQTKLVLTWDMVTQDGGHDIEGYLVQVSQDINNDAVNDNANGGDTWTSLVETDAVTTVDKDTLTHPYEGIDNGLAAGAARWFRVIAITDENDGNADTGGTKVDVTDGIVTATPSSGETSPEPEDITAAEEVRGVTDGAPDPTPDADPTPPPAPVDLTAEKATDTNELAETDRGVLLLWNEPQDGDAITSYEIERSLDGGTTWTPIGQITWSGMTDPDERTSFTDSREPVLDGTEDLRYQVGSRSTAIGDPSWTMVMYPAEHPHMFSAPTMVAATSSGGTVTVTWTPGAQADSQVIAAVNPDDITDYCLYVDTSGILASYECKNLTVGTTYAVLVIALDGQGGYMLGRNANGMIATHLAE